jgi:hypothetical protein
MELDALLHLGYVIAEPFAPASTLRHARTLTHLAHKEGPMEYAGRNSSLTSCGPVPNLEICPMPDTSADLCCRADIGYPAGEFGFNANGKTQTMTDTLQLITVSDVICILRSDRSERL